MTKDEAIKELEEYLQDADKAISEGEEYIRGWKSALLVAVHLNERFAVDAQKKGNGKRNTESTTLRSELIYCITN